MAVHLHPVDDFAFLRRFRVELPPAVSAEMVKDGIEEFIVLGDTTQIISALPSNKKHPLGVTDFYSFQTSRGRIASIGCNAIEKRCKLNLFPATPTLLDQLLMAVGLKRRR